MELVFLGTPALAATTLRGLHSAGHDVRLVVTGLDAKRGRGGATSPSPVKAAAIELGLEVSHDPADAADAGAALGVVVAYGRILRPELLAVLPMVNLHFSLLPRWRGAAPVERAILTGDETTGVCLMAVEEGLDTGGVYARATTPVGDKTLHELWDELSVTGTRLLVDWLAEVEANGGTLPDPAPQVGEATYAEKLTAADRRVDPDDDPELQLRKVRLGGAWTEVGGRRVRLLAAERRGAGVEFTTVQPEGRRPMPFADWARGVPPEALGWLA